MCEPRVVTVVSCVFKASYFIHRDFTNSLCKIWRADCVHYGQLVNREWKSDLRVMNLGFDFNPWKHFFLMTGLWSSSLVMLTIKLFNKTYFVLTVVPSTVSRHFRIYGQIITTDIFEILLRKSCAILTRIRNKKILSFKWKVTTIENWRFVWFGIDPKCVKKS